MNFRRLAAAALLAATTLTLTATPAMAHAELISSDPAQGAALPTPPTQIRLTFNEPVTPAPDAVRITGPGGTTWTAGTPTIAGAALTIPVQPAGPAGPYTLTYQVISSDGDPVTGNIQFTLTTPATTPQPPPTTTTTTPATTTAAATSSPAPSAATADEDGDGIPVWVWIAAAAVLAGAAATFAIRKTRTRP